MGTSTISKFKYSRGKSTLGTLHWSLVPDGQLQSWLRPASCFAHAKVSQKSKHSPITWLTLQKQFPTRFAFVFWLEETIKKQVLVGRSAQLRRPVERALVNGFPSLAKQTHSAHVLVVCSWVAPPPPLLTQLSLGCPLKKYQPQQSASL